MQYALNYYQVIYLDHYITISEVSGSICWNLTTVTWTHNQCFWVLWLITDLSLITHSYVASHRSFTETLFTFLVLLLTSGDCQTVKKYHSNHNMSWCNTQIPQPTSSFWLFYCQLVQLRIPWTTVHQIQHRSCTNGDRFCTKVTL